MHAEGDRPLAHLTFDGPDFSGVHVLDIVLMVGDEGLSQLPGTVPMSVDVVAEPVKSCLTPDLPDPFAR